ncbi:MAG: nucleoside-diphosphate sugar epimerase/dehydratase [Gammaproteobacteria bacterium]
MRWVERLRSPVVAFLHDMAIIPLAWFGAYWLRFNLEPIPSIYLNQALDWLPAIMVLQGAVFVYFGLYRGDWRFASVPDLVRIVKAVAIGTALCALAIFLVTRLEHVPRSVLPIYAFLLVAGLGGPRFVYRWIKDRKLYVGAGQRVLIAGAGRAGEMLIRDLLRAPDRRFRPVCFVDDQAAKKGLDIHGVRVLGPCSAIPNLVKEHGIELVLIALPSATSKQMQRVVEYCEEAGIPFRTLPRIEDLVSGRVGVQALREVSIEDLLGREPVTLDWQRIRGGIAGNRVLVSGGGGSIGSELCRQIARLEPAALVVVDSCEFNLYSIEQELKAHFPGLTVSIHLADVTDRVAIERITGSVQPEVVFHAAAYKHVPMLEGQLRQAVRNNVLGTRVLAEAAAACGCDVFVLISTDKAVNPANVMGATKRIGEIYCQNMNARATTRFITVRFGNVLGSAGSVVPLFRKQIEAGGPVTVTHPEITRFFMTIPEACQLIMQSAVMGSGGEIFVLDMGSPVKITYLAEQMIRLSGREPGTDIEIAYTGLRPGEKLFEELFHEKEALSGTGHAQIFLAQHRVVDWTWLEEIFDSIEQACAAYDEERLAHLVRKLVPELDAASIALPDNVVALANRKPNFL